MITKSYPIMCEKCSNSQGLLGRTLKDCIKEAKRDGWKNSKGIWKCQECNENNK